MSEEPRRLLVTAEWDAEAAVWVATSDDVPGLATEAPSVEALAEKLATMIPELLELNAASGSAAPIAFELVARRLGLASASA